MKQGDSRRVTDRRLVAAYHEANQLDEAGVEAICPLFYELSEIAIRYRDESFVARGGSKEVSKVYDSRTKNWVAMARPRGDLGPEHLDRFVHEAWLTSSLVHPNIINIYDVGVDAEGQPFFTMDLKSDRTLANYVDPGRKPAEGRSVDERELLEIFVKVCDAVAYAHSRGILHLDLKPDNIQVDRFGEVLVCDWGLGKSVDDEEEPEFGPAVPGEAGTMGMTLAGEIKGTPGFMAPEQTDPDSPRDERTDGFALGCILYAILTRAAVFTGESGEELLRQAREAEIVPPRERFPEGKIPASLEAVVMKAVARDPARRYDSVGDLRSEVSRYLAGYTTAAENPGFGREFVRFVGRNQMASAILLVALVTLTVLSVLFIQGIQRQQALARQESARAERLKSKAESLEETTETLASQIESWDQDRVGLAEDIARSCLELTNRSIFRSTTLLASHQQISQLAELSLAIDPQNLTTQRLRFRLANYQMDFAKSASLLPIVGNRVPPKQAWIAGHFRHFAFNREMRPSTAQLIAFLEEVDSNTKVGRVGTEPAAFLDPLLAYDLAARSDPENYGPVIQAFLKFINQDWDPDGFLHDPQERSLTLRFDPPFRFDTYNEALSVLRHLRLRSLRLECGEPADLVTLQQLPLESLDLRACSLPPLQNARMIALPGLLEIHVMAGQFDLDQLRRKIRSDKPLKIIEH